MCNEITGRLFETATLGKCTASQSGYVPFREAARQVREHQPANLCPAAKRLQEAVAQRFEKLGCTVRFYTAVHSTMDYFHSVDAFFEVSCGLMVTLDVTTNPLKTEGKADVIVQADDFENLPLIADRIVRAFAEKARAKRRRKYH